jgi:hypothetical protein
VGVTHLLGFLISYATNAWPAGVVGGDSSLTFVPEGGSAGGGSGSGTKGKGNTEAAAASGIGATDSPNVALQVQESEVAWPCRTSLSPPPPPTSSAAASQLLHASFHSACWPTLGCYKCTGLRGHSAGAEHLTGEGGSECPTRSNATTGVTTEPAAAAAVWEVAAGTPLPLGNLDQQWVASASSNGGAVGGGVGGGVAPNAVVTVALLNEVRRRSGMFQIEAMSSVRARMVGGCGSTSTILQHFDAWIRRS